MEAVRLITRSMTPKEEKLAFRVDSKGLPRCFGLSSLIKKLDSDWVTKNPDHVRFYLSLLKMYDLEYDKIPTVNLVSIGEGKMPEITTSLKVQLAIANKRLHPNGKIPPNFKAETPFFVTDASSAGCRISHRGWIGDLFNLRRPENATLFNNILAVAEKRNTELFHILRNFKEIPKDAESS